MKTCYQDKRFNDRSRLTIQRINSIIRTYRAQGLDLTLRQLFYRFVAAGWLPNQDKEYKNLGNLVNDARLAGTRWNPLS